MSSQFFANLAVIFSIGVLASTWYSTKLKDKEGQLQLTEKTNEIKTLQKLHQAEIKEKTDDIQNLQMEVIQLQGVGLNKMEHQINTITGGDSYPLLALNSDGGKTAHIFSGSLWACGNYPLRNLSLRVSITQNGKTVDFPQTQPLDSLRQMTPTSVGQGGMVDLSIDPNSKIMIRFIADNGTWIQKVYFRKNEDGEFQYKTELVADQQPDLPPLVESNYGEGIKMGTFANWRTTQYKASKP